MHKVTVLFPNNNFTKQDSKNKMLTMLSFHVTIPKSCVCTDLSLDETIFITGKILTNNRNGNSRVQSRSNRYM